MTLAEADTAVAVLLEARDDAIDEVLYNDGDLDELREAQSAYMYAIGIWGRLDDEATADAKKEVENKKEVEIEPPNDVEK